jgi:Tetratricopeptide repeat
VLDPAEAQALLAAILTPGPARGTNGAAGELCAELGFLPLAIEQAGAYLAQAGATPREYLDLLARYPAAIYQAAAEGGDAARTIARIWHVTLDRLADGPLAGQVLRILAWYAPDGIPRTLLDGLADPPAVLRAVGRLAAYSMLTAGAGTLAVHRLVQAVTRTPHPGDPHRDTQAIDDATRPPASSPAPSRTGRIRRAGRAGGCCSRTLTPWPATPHRTPAPRPPPTSSTRPDCSSTARASPAARPGYLERAPVDYVRVLGADHPDTLGSRNNLAYAWQAAGDLGRAIPLYEQTLADSVRVLGADHHPRTLGSRNNLAYAWQAAGAGHHPAVRADRLRVLGADHPC